MNPSTDSNLMESLGTYEEAHANICNQFYFVSTGTHYENELFLEIANMNKEFLWWATQVISNERTRERIGRREGRNR